MNYFYLIVFIVFQLSFIIQLYYTLIVHRRLAAFKSKENNQPQHPVSVIICARNEQQNLIQNLPGILEQNYPDFEVVVVNDCSLDDSDMVLREFSARYPRLKVVTINEHERFKHGKKFAATLGIKAAKHEHLLFTDSDCRPASPKWLAQMQANFNGNTQIVLGYSPYEKLSGLLNRFIRFETFLTALNYLSFALARKPYMGVGRNLAYTKSLFFKGKGFASHMHILSGDDDLFVNQHAHAENTVIEIHPDAQVWSEPKRTWGAYVKQKIRHQGAGKAYKKSHKQMLGLQAGSAILFYISLAILVALQAPWWFLLGIYMVRFLSQIFVYYPVLKKLHYADLIWWLPVFDIIYYFYVFALSTIIQFKKKIEWK